MSKYSPALAPSDSLRFRLRAHRGDFLQKDEISEQIFRRHKPRVFSLLAPFWSRASTHKLWCVAAQAISRTKMNVTKKSLNAVILFSKIRSHALFNEQESFKVFVYLDIFLVA